MVKKLSFFPFLDPKNFPAKTPKNFSILHQKKKRSKEIERMRKYALKSGVVRFLIPAKASEIDKLS